MFIPRIAVAATLAVLGVAAPPPHGAFAASSIVTVPARGVGGATLGPAVDVASRSFPAGMRFVVATVTGRHATKSTKRPTMLSVDLVCGDERVQAAVNVVTSATLAPRRIMRDATDCRVIATSARTDATAGDGVQVSTRLTAEAITWGATGYRPHGWPDLVRTGGRFDAVPTTFAVPAHVSRLHVTGDTKVTTCTSVGGSRENGSPYLCEKARLKREGSKVSVSVVVHQLGPDGEICAQRTVSRRTAQIAPKAHHDMISQQASYALSPSSNCTRNVRIKQYVKVLGGADIVVHRRGTMTNVYG